MQLYNGTRYEFENDKNKKCGGASQDDSESAKATAQFDHSLRCRQKESKSLVGQRYIYCIHILYPAIL